MIDTHCHLDGEAFDRDRVDVADRAWKAGLSGIVIPGTRPDTWDRLVDYARATSRVWACAGIHPQVLPDALPEADAEALDKLADRLRRGGVIAVGECGLDGPSVARAPLERQVHVFREHLRLARVHHLPLMVHCYHAHPALLDVLRDEGPLSAGLVIHSYSGGPQLIRDLTDLGCYFGISGSLTFRNARKPVASAQAIPIDRLLLETDAPDQTPAPHQGTRNEPGWLPLVAHAVAHARGVPRDELVAHADANAMRLFRGLG